MKYLLLLRGYWLLWSYKIGNQACIVSQHLVVFHVYAFLNVMVRNTVLSHIIIVSPKVWYGTGKNNTFWYGYPLFTICVSCFEFQSLFWHSSFPRLLNGFISSFVQMFCALLFHKTASNIPANYPDRYSLNKSAHTDRNVWKNVRTHIRCMQWFLVRLSSDSMWANSMFSTN